MKSNKDLISDQVKQYFCTLLQQIGIKYNSIDILDGSEKSINVVCTIARVAVKTENEEHNFIIKSSSRDKEFREFIQSSVLFERELYVYNNVLHEYEVFQKKKNILNLFQSYPKIYGSTTEKMNEAIVLQDMTSDGYKTLDCTDPADYNHIMLIMKEYGKLHALSYALRDQQPQVFQKLSKNMEEVFFLGSGWNSIKPAVRFTLTKAFETINTLDNKILHEKCTKSLLQLEENMRKVFKTDKYSVFGHSDCWINNFLFKYDNPNNPNIPTKVCIIDWQLSRLASPVLDLSYFLFASTDEKIRENHFHDFIKEYHNNVCSFYTELTGISEHCLPYEVLQEHLRKLSIYGLYVGLEAIHVMLNMAKEKKNRSEKMDVFKCESENITEFNNRAKSVILDFDKLGFEFY